ncbi:IclR family transcriptional regulator [Corynebacterium heidelbergense]|uniref:IclR family transcriptional regulator n=1 Tax=Corynebacterium heidelbergense TaxID=2055947 RepID=A0A364V4D2_9CORY|nr:IclR family transcriptional regulator [Corynebacterium heidelbergense]RAV31492.1 IclR family transcriptional regulator [Corynebacterium heidelbergense]
MSQEDQPPAAQTRRGSITALANGIRVLQTLSHYPTLRGVTELAAETGLHKSTVSRILSTLEEHQLVERDGTTRRYRLGVGTVAIAGPLLAHLDVRRAGGEIIREITATTQESTALVTWTGVDGVVVDHVDSPRLVKHITPVGTRIGRLRAASMQVFLAECTAGHRQRLYSTNGLSDPQDVEAGLDEVAQRGYGLNDGRTDPEEWSVAAPIRDYDGRCIAAVLIAVPRSRMTDAARADLPARAVEAARQITQRLGG